MKRQLIAAMVAGVLGWDFGVVARGDVIIDSFEDPQGPFSSGINTLGILTDPFPHVLGGRGMLLPTNATAKIVITNGTSMLDLEGFHGDFSLVYGGSSTFLPAPRPMALKVNTATDYLQLTFSDFTSANGQNMILNTFLQYELWQGVIPQPIVTTITDNGPQIINVPLAGFGDRTLDFITFEFHLPGATHFQLDSVAVATLVPEPQSLALFGIFLPVLILRHAYRERRTWNVSASQTD